MRAHPRRLPEKSATPDWVTCGCGKRAFRTRALARKAAKGLSNLGNGTLSAYPCQIYPGTGYHVGHLPASVKAGERPRSDLRNHPR